MDVLAKVITILASWLLPSCKRFVYFFSRLYYKLCTVIFFFEVILFDKNFHDHGLAYEERGTNQYTELGYKYDQENL